MDTPTAPRTPALEERYLTLEERRLNIDEMKLRGEQRAARTASEAAFELEQRMAQTLAASPFLPQNVGRDPTERVAAAWGVLRYAQMLGVDPYVLAQQIYVVHGRVGFSSAFLIALVNGRGGLLTPIDWTISGSGADLSVTCSATDSTGAVRSVTMTRKEVDTWGWAAKSDPWKANPALMMRYRTAAMLIRLYFAGAVMGLTMTSEELQDVARGGEAPPSPMLPEVEPTRLLGTSAPARDFVAEAEEIARRAEAVTVPAEVVEEERAVVADPIAALPAHVQPLVREVLAESGATLEQLVAFMAAEGRPLADLTEPGAKTYRLKLGKDGGLYPKWTAFVARGA